MKKIALFLPSFAGGGAEKAMVQLANALVARNYCVDLVVVTAGGECKNQIDPVVNVIDLKKSRLILSLFALIRYLKLNKPTVLYSSMTHSNLIACCAKVLSRANVPLFMREVAMLQRAKLKDKISVFLAKYAYRYVDGVITCSQVLADDLVKQFDLNQSKVKCIYNPFDFEKIHQLSELVLNDEVLMGKKYLLAAGRLVEDKNYPALLKVFARVSKKSSAVCLVILGQGKLKSALEKLADDLSIKDKVLFLGFKENPYQYMKHASVFVLSSKSEGLPCVLVEALICGCPVVSTDCPVGGPRELLQQGKLGALVPVGDDVAMATEIEKILATNKKAQFDDDCFDCFKLDRVVDEYVRLFKLPKST